MEVFFMKLVEMSISASWLVLVVIALRLLMKKAPRWVHVLLWALVAVRLMCPVSLESEISLIPTDLTDRIVEDIPNSYVGPSSSYWDHMPEYQEAVEAGAEPIYGGEGHYYVITGEDHLTPVMTMQQILSWVWAGGIAAMILYAIVSYLRLKQKVSACISLDNGVCICDYIDTPFILGIIRPQIYLPSSMEPGSAAHVLAHERAHIARKDHWWKPLGYVLLSVYWFNPVLWLAYILLCRDIEMACDERVIRDMQVPEKKAYSEALLNCSVNRRTIAACPLAFGEVGVKERVKAVLNYKKPTFWIVLTAVLALIITAVCFLTDPVERFDQKAADYLEEYAFEQVSGRMDREEVTCIAAREGYGLVYCKGEGPVLTLYQYEKNGNQIEILASCTGEYAISGGISLNHLESGGKHIYFGTISEYHFNPTADMNTWINWDYLSMTDGNGNTRKQDMTGREGFLFLLDAPMADFQAVDGLGTVCIDYPKFLEQGYSMKEVYLLNLGAAQSPFGRYYRVTGPVYSDFTGDSYSSLNTENLFLLTEGKNLLSRDSAGQGQLYSIASFMETQLIADTFDALFLEDTLLGTSLREENYRAWECQRESGIGANYHDFCYLLQQRDGTLLLVLGQWWDAQYREGESLIRKVYRLQPIESDDPFAESKTPYQWTLNLRPEYVQLVQTTVRDSEGVPQHKTLGQRELSRLMRILNALTEEQITQGRLKKDNVVSCHVQCMDENGWNADLDVNLQYDGDAVQMVFTTEGAKRYPEGAGENWVIRSEALNDFLSVYAYKTPEEDPFSDPDNAYRWCSNISLPYLEAVYISGEDKDHAYLGELGELQQRELLRILNSIPESAFEMSQMPGEAEAAISVDCRNLVTDDPGGIGVSLRLLNGEVHYTQADEWSGAHQTWKISSHALAEYIQELFESDWTLWREIPVSGGVGLGNDAHKFVKWDMEGLEMLIPELDCFEYRVDEDGIRFKPEHVEGWILVQYRTEPFAVCGTGLEKSDVTYKNGKYAGVQGWYDGNKAWSFIDLTATDGEITHNVVFLNEETAPWVTEYFYEIVEVIHELSFLTTG